MTRETRIIVVAAGGIYDGRTIAAALSLGASGVWIGTRFLASDEAATTTLKKVLLEACRRYDAYCDLHGSSGTCFQISFCVGMGTSTSG